jgi:Tol biopolymer transport system component
VRATSIRVLLIALLGITRLANAQSNFARPALDWMTVRTRYFEVHYPTPMAEWVQELTTRLDAVHDAVSAFVGYAPNRRITVIVEDPVSQSNGFANAPVDDPLIVLWPTPPDPAGMLGTYRDWPELLAVHEYAHIAHLSRPTRNPRERRLWRFLPLRVGPLASRTPRWAVEGYATYVEGRLTGSGRPHGAARAAYLRQWALEGKLPTYAQLSSGGDFAASSMAYLAGSAFLEWLVAQRGDSSLVAVWRRLSARQPRTFAEAFAGVYGAPPDELYGRFTVELTRRALMVRDTLAAAGLDTGVLVQRRRWATGEPAVSVDGSLIAVELAARTLPGPLVVWRTEERVDTARARRARERALALDPQDVPAVPGDPRPKVPIATLRPSAGRPFHSPRFFADTSRLLVTHDDPLGDGAYRSDLYVWNYRADRLRRVTRGASIRDADPLPDGKSAVGVRCEDGLCDLVRVDLETGAVTTLRKSTPSTPYYRPRVSPDGQSAVVAVQRDGRWRLALIPIELTATDGDSDVQLVDPDDDANRYDAAFLPGGRRIVCVSDAGGVPNLEVIDLEGGEPVGQTRVTSAVSAPAPIPNDTSVIFLALHARGLDLRRVTLSSNRTGRPATLSASLVPAVPNPPAPVDTLPRSVAPRAYPYGAGPHQHRVLPGATYSTEGAFATLSLVGLDPVGRLVYSANGVFGEPSTWRGVSITASWRGSRAVVPGALTIDGTLFRAEQRPSQQRAFADVNATLPGVLDAVYTGATVGTATTRDYGFARLQVRVGGSLGDVDRSDGSSDASRGLVFGEARGSTRVRRGGYRLDLLGVVHASRGANGGLAFTRGIGTLTADVSTPFGGARIDATLAGSDEGGGPYERFAIGGWPSPLVDAPVLSQRIPMPALPTGFAIGTHATVLRASTALGPLRPFYWVATTRENLTGWNRVAGVDADYSFAAFPAFAVPAIGLKAGAAYSWDAPFRHRAGVYIGVTYKP